MSLIFFLGPCHRFLHILFAQLCTDALRCLNAPGGLHNNIPVVLHAQSALMISSLASSMLITHLLFTTNSSPVNLFRLCSFPISVADFSFHCRIFRRQHLFISAGNEPGKPCLHRYWAVAARVKDSPLPVTGYLILTTLIDMYYRPAVNMMYKGCKRYKN